MARRWVTGGEYKEKSFFHFDDIMMGKRTFFRWSKKRQAWLRIYRGKRG